ncbi:hypothetical protein LNP18_05915 [Leuconostoc citreum]|uniref:hypothetical protein n=1 Tax=Leuconostoc citreum TaxID=33964 RepID=UPI00200AC2F7|nr:hypothetical protein [Leuconostoc citreum]MCK8605637.1 hypothetical protein [Leuconostoc citreum]
MSNKYNQALQKRVNFIKEHLDMLDSALETMPILVASMNNEQTEHEWLEAITRIKLDLKKTYSDLYLFPNK